MIHRLLHFLSRRSPENRGERPQLFDAFEQIKKLRLEHEGSVNRYLILITGSEAGGQEVDQLLKASGEDMILFHVTTGEHAQWDERAEHCFRIDRFPETFELDNGAVWSMGGEKDVENLQVLLVGSEPLIPRVNVPVLAWVPDKGPEPHRVILWAESVNEAVFGNLEEALKVLGGFEHDLAYPNHPKMHWLHANLESEKGLITYLNRVTSEQAMPVEFASISKYHEVEELLRRKEVHRKLPDIDRLFDRGRLNKLDGKEHTNLRSMFQPMFTPKGIERLETRIRIIAEELLTNLNGRKAIDFNAELCSPFNLRVLSEFMGLSVEDLKDWEGEVESRIRRLMPEYPNHGLSEVAFFDAFKTRRRRWLGHPADPWSVIGLMQQLPPEEDEMEVVAGNLALSVLTAGIQATRVFLNQVVNHLVQHPEDWRDLCANPESLPRAVEEFLRLFSTSEKLVWIHARVDFEMGDHRFQAGDLLRVEILKANHDPDIFPNPEKFDWRRPLKRHLAFGIGAHHCLGAWLVRNATRILLEHLMRQPEILTA